MARPKSFEQKIVNLPEVTAFAAEMAELVTAPEAKAWFQTRLYRRLVGSTIALREFGEEDKSIYRHASMTSEAMIKNWPQEPLWVFAPSSQSSSDLRRVARWIAHHESGEGFLRKLADMTPKAAIKESREWVRRTSINGSRRLEWELELQLDGGFHWVHYLRQASMEADGFNLPLHGQSGVIELNFDHKAVDAYALRDRDASARIAVVAHRDRIVGVAHRISPIVPKKLRSMTVDFLNYLDLPAACPLDQSGIDYRTGRYWLTESSLEHRRHGDYDCYFMPPQGVEQRILIEHDGMLIGEAHTQDGQVEMIRNVEAGRRTLIEALNATGMPALSDFINIEGTQPPLSYREGRYGEADEVGAANVVLRGKS